MGRWYPKDENKRKEITMFQKMIILGRITQLENKSTFTKVNLAVNKKYNGKETTEFFNCVCFKKTAEIVNQYMHVGEMVFVEAEMQTTKKDDKTYTNFIINNIRMVGDKKENHVMNDSVDF